MYRCDFCQHYSYCIPDECLSRYNSSGRPVADAIFTKHNSIYKGGEAMRGYRAVYNDGRIKINFEATSVTKAMQHARDIAAKEGYKFEYLESKPMEQ